MALVWSFIALQHFQNWEKQEKPELIFDEHRDRTSHTHDLLSDP